jgi:small GTP-binding protein
MTNLSRKFYVFGLDQSGKSVFVNYLTTGELKAILPPTLAFSISDLQFKKLKIVIWDAPGQKIFRSLWLRYVNRSDLIFYIVDASDRNRFAEAKEELDKIVMQYRGEYAAPLILCLHKSDLPAAIENLKEARELFKLDYVDNRDIHKFETSIFQPDTMKAVYNLLEKLYGSKEKFAL